MVPGEPDSARQRDDGRDSGDDAEQAEPFAAPSGRQQLRGERAGSHAAQAEAEPAHEADPHHDRLGLAREQRQGLPAEQHGPGREHRPVAEPADRRGGRGLGRDGAEQQGPGHQPGARTADPGRRRQHRHHRQQQEEAGREVDSARNVAASGTLRSRGGTAATRGPASRCSWQAR